MHIARLLSLTALLTAYSPASAATFGDVDITVESEPQGYSRHGYAELRVRIVNRSAAEHTVRLTYPRSTYAYGADHLRGVSRTVTVEPGANVRVSLAYPEKLMINASDLGVAVDGKEFDQGLSVRLGSSSRRYSYMSSGSGGNLILYSRTVDTRFPDWVRMRALGGGSFTSTNHEVVRATLEAELWSPNWLSYSRYDGIVLTSDDLRKMPVEVRSAVESYVECGGSLLVLGRDPPLPGSWKFTRVPPRELQSAAPGFGECLLSADPEVQRWPIAYQTLLHQTWSRTEAPWQREKAPAEANRAFPVVDDVSVPVRGLLVVIFLFVILIGPVNLIVLTRMKRKLWLFWTVPVVSFFTCVLVLGYMAVTEGWQGRSRVEGFTILDENSRRATTIGWCGFYAPLVPRGGLHFSTESEVSYQNGGDPYSYGYRSRGSSSSALTMEWSGDQHLASGWLAPRVPSHFAIRKSELRRERVTFEKGANGMPEAVNGLGADISELWYADEQGTLYAATAIPAGGRMPLQPANRPTGPANRSFRNIYSADWTTLTKQMVPTGVELLRPRTYFATLESAPFMDEGMPASVRRAKSVVYGILKEGP